MELFTPQPKLILRTHKGRYASELQFLRDENKRFKNELELERRKSPAWREIRKYNVMLYFLKEQTKNQKDIISQLKSTIQKNKRKIVWKS